MNDLLKDYILYWEPIKRTNSLNDSLRDILRKGFGDPNHYSMIKRTVLNIGHIQYLQGIRDTQPTYLAREIDIDLKARQDKR